MKNKYSICFLKFFGGMLVILLAIWASVIFWLGPSYTESALIDDISAFWDGKIIIDGIDFRLFHPITVDSVILENKAGKPSLEAKGVTLLFEK